MSNNLQLIRVVLADDHSLMRAGIRAELDKLPWVEVVGEANDGREALALVKLRRPDAAILDMSMPGLNGLEALARITKEFPRVRVLVLSMHENEEYIWRAMRAGAVGYLFKSAAAAELGAALQRVIRGGIYLVKVIAARLAKNLPKNGIAGAKSPLEKLTNRQREIVQLIAEGRNTKEIGAILTLSPKTVEYHRLRLMQTLNVRDIPGLVRFALRFGLVAPEF